MPEPPAHKPLAGLRIVEVSTFVAAPLGGMTLAQLGAEVVRVDPLGGAADHSRWPLSASGTSLYWTGLNKAKRSIAVDLRSADGQELVTRLVCDSGPGGGILLANAVGRPWLAYQALAARRPDVICLHIEGNPDGSAAVDYTVNASHGFPLITGPTGHDGPVNHVLPAWDVACGLYAAIGLLAAERRRAITGHGQELHLALSDVALATAGNLGFLAEAAFGQDRARQGNYLYGSFGHDFTSRDGQRFMLVALTSRHWRDLVTATGLDPVVSALEDAYDADFSRESDRYQCREVLVALLQRWFRERDFHHIRAALDRTSVLWSPYRTFRELAEGEQLQRNQVMGLVDQPGVGTYLAPGSPVRTGQRVVERAPVLGEHTDVILSAWLGLGPDAIQDLRERGIVQPAGTDTADAHAARGRAPEGEAGDGPASTH